MQASHRQTGGLSAYLRKLGLFSHNAKMVLAYATFTGLAFGVFRLLFNFYVLSLGGYTELFLGNLTSAQSVASLLMALPAAYIADRYNHKILFIITGLVSAAAFLGLVSLPFRGFLIFFSFAQGISMSIRQVVAAPFLMNNTGREERQYVFSFNFGLMTFAQFVGNLLGGYLPLWLGGLADALPTSTTAYRLALGSMVIVSLMAIIPILLIKNKPQDADREVQLPWVQLKDHGFKLAKFIIPQIIIGLGAGLMMPFMNLYFRNVLGRTDAVIGTLFGIGALGMAIAQFIAPPLSDRLGKINTVILTQAVSIPFLMTLGLMAWVAPRSGAMTAWFLIAGVAYLFRLALMNLGGPVYTTFILEQIDEDLQALATSLNNISFQFGWAIMPSISGWLQDSFGSFGFVLIFSMVSVLYMLGIATEWVFFRRQIRARREQRMAEAEALALK